MYYSEFDDKKSTFRMKYRENLINRYSNASLAVEGEDGNLSDSKQAMRIYNQTNAIEYALDLPANEYLTIHQIKQIESLLTGGAETDFRKTRAIVLGSNVERSKPRYIYMDLYNLFDNYYNIWKDLNPFLREANFHISFLHIHPFEDGNGRTARIILIKNLYDLGIPLCIITKEVKEEYCSYIENNDREGLARLFEKLSNKELATMIGIYNDLNSRGLIIENLMTDEEEEKYEEYMEKNYGKKVVTETDHNDKPLRNISNLDSIFKYNSLPKESRSKLNSVGLLKCDVLEDPNTLDKAIYYEDSRTLVVLLGDDDRCFKMLQEGNDYIYKIDEKIYYEKEFEYELNKKKVLVKKR